MKKVKNSDSNNTKITTNNSNVTLKLLKMNESKLFTIGLFKNEINNNSETCDNNGGKVNLNTKTNGTTTINMNELKEIQNNNDEIFAKKINEKVLTTCPNDQQMTNNEKSSSTKSNSSKLNESKSSYISDAGIEGSVLNEKVNSSKSSIESNCSSDISKNFLKINDSKSFICSHSDREAQKVNEFEVSNKSLYSQVNKSNKSSVELVKRKLSAESTKLDLESTNHESNENKQSVKSITTQFLNDNLCDINSVSNNVNSTPRASATEICSNRNSRDISKNSLLHRTSFGINVSRILSASSAEINNSNNKQSLKSGVELNDASTSALTNSTNNTGNKSNLIGSNVQSMATEITNLTNSNNKINIQNSKATYTKNSNEILLRGLVTENPAFIDSIEDEKGFECLVPRPFPERSILKDSIRDDDESVCYDNKDDVLKNILLIQRHNDEIARKKSLKFKSIFRRKRSASNKNYTISKFNSIKSNLESLDSVNINGKIKPIETNHYMVEIRVVFYKVGEIDTLNEKFYAEAFIEASWIDPYLESNKQYNPKLNWNPEILILNSIGVLKEEIWHTQAPFKENNSRIIIHQTQSDLEQADCICTKICDLDESKQTPGCLVIERRRVNGMFWQLLDLKDFPSDVQNLTLTISTSKHSNEITLLHSKEIYSSVNVNCFLDHQEWHLYKHVRVNEFLRESVFTSETFPAIDLTICVARRPAFYYLNAFFLIFLITISSLAVFSVNCSLPQNRLQTSCTMLLTSVTFKWITNRSLPTVSYMTSLDKYSLGCIILVSLQCIWHGVIGFLNHTEGKCLEQYAKFDLFAFIVTCSLFCLLNISFIIIFIRNGFCKRRGLNRLETDYINNLVGKRVTRLKSMFHAF